MKKDVKDEQNRHCTTEGTTLHMRSSSKFPDYKKKKKASENKGVFFFLVKNDIFWNAVLPQPVISYSTEWLNITLITMEDFAILLGQILPFKSQSKNKRKAKRKVILSPICMFTWDF